MSRVLQIHGPNEQRPLSPEFLAGIQETRERTRRYLERKESRRRWQRRALIAGGLIVGALVVDFAAAGLGMLAGLVLEALLKTLERL